MEMVREGERDNVCLADRVWYRFDRQAVGARPFSRGGLRPQSDHHFEPGIAQVQGDRPPLEP